MPRKQLEVPPAVARTFVEDMRAYFAEPNTIRRDEIAARQAWPLDQHISSKKKVRTHDVVELFYAMRDQA